MNDSSGEEMKYSNKNRLVNKSLGIVFRIKNSLRASQNGTMKCQADAFESFENN